MFENYYEELRMIVSTLSVDRQHDFITSILRIIRSARVYANREGLSQYEKDCAQFLDTHLRSIFATIVSSSRLQTGEPLPLMIRNSETLDTDPASSRLKLASILYCCGDLKRAAYELDDIASRLDNFVQSDCACR